MARPEAELPGGPSEEAADLWLSALYDVDDLANHRRRPQVNIA